MLLPPGATPKNAAVAATTGLIQRLSSEELAGVMAHELAHVKNRDTLTMTITATIAGAISMLANFGIFFGGNRNNPLGIIGVILVAILAPMAAMLVQMAISRTREYEADRIGAEICGHPLWLASALRKISQAAESIDNGRRGGQSGNRPHVHHQSAARPGRRQSLLHPSQHREPNPALAGNGVERADRRTAPAPLGLSPAKPRLASARALGFSLSGHLLKPVHMSRHKATARGVALEFLSWVLDRRRSLDDALARHQGWSQLTARDRAFARLLTATVLRRLAQIDQLLAACLDRPLKARQGELQNILRLGAAQLMFLETPAHAAVSTALELAERPHLNGYKGLINAVLRRLAREGPEHAQAQDAARLAVPDWLWERWCSAYGEAATRRIGEALLSDPPLDVSTKEKSEVWARRLGGQTYPWGSVRIAEARGEIPSLPGYEDGAWWVQDLAAALTTRILGPLSGVRTLDLCAAPGGKTAALLMAGAEVTAVERAVGRVARLKENLARLKLSGPGRGRGHLVLAAQATGRACGAGCTLQRHRGLAPAPGHQSATPTRGDHKHGTSPRPDYWRRQPRWLRPAGCCFTSSAPSSQRKVRA